MSQIEKIFEQVGDHNRIYTIDRANSVNFYIEKQSTDISSTFADISSSLLSYRNYFTEGNHVNRFLTNDLYTFCKKANDSSIKSKIAVVKAGAGLGKSVVMRELLEQLTKEDNIGVLGIKADRIVNYDGVATDIIGKSTPLIDLVKQCASRVTRFVLLVDQIDALSQTMSNDRRAIVRIDSLIKLVAQIQNAKIVISCRPYDLQYDSILEEYSKYTSYELKRLTESEIKEVLGKANIRQINIGPKLMSFLSTPLHLYLFCKINDREFLNEDLTLQKMYDKIWSEYIIKEPRNHGYDRNMTIQLLDKISNNMFEKQSLAVDRRPYEDEYDGILSLLTTNNILSDDGSYIQFFHQSFFDYTYARLFVQSGKSLTKELNKAHQGLFIRQRVKQILTYERGFDEQSYAQHLNEIFYSGKSYRYHIKMLVLTTIGTFNQILPCERDFIGNKILKDKKLRKVFVESILSQEWFTYFVETDYCKSIVNDGNPSELKLLLDLCERLLYTDSDVVINYLYNELCNIDSDELRKSIVEIINRSTTLQNCLQIIPIYKKVYDASLGITMPYYLEKVADCDPHFVIQELLKDLDIKLSHIDKDDFPFNIPVGHEVQSIYKEICEKNVDFAFELLYASLLKILEHNERAAKFSNNRLRHSSHYMFYVRKEPYRTDFHYELADMLFDLVEKMAQVNPEWIEQHVPTLKETGFSLFYQIIMAGYTKNTLYFKHEIFKILTDKELLEDFYPQYTIYYALLMLKTSFNTFDEEEKSQIISTILNLSPELERTPMKELHKYGFSLTSIGRTSGQFLNALGDDNLKNYPEAKRTFHKLLEKYKDLTCTPPRIQTQTGWISIPKENRKKMSDKDIMQSLIAFPSIVEIGKPDAMGTNIAFGKDAEEDPSRFSSIIYNLLEGDQYRISSISEGIEGLMRADYEYEVIEDLFDKEVKRVRRLKIDNAGDLMKLLHMTEYFIKRDTMPEFVIDFICDVLTLYPEDEEDDRLLGDDLFNTGINRVKGCAGFYLVKCWKHKQYENKIFGTIESIALTASAVTRSAILLEMRLLSNLNPDRARTLYLTLLHDFDDCLMSMQLHNYNPILSFIGSHFADILPLVEKAVEYSKCHKTIALFLWLAYYNGNAEALDYLQKILSLSNDAKVEILQYFMDNRDEKTKDYTDKFIYQFLDCDAKDVGFEYDTLFNHLKKWNKDDENRFIEAYSCSKASMHALRGVYNYFEKMASNDSKNCLIWISRIYQHKKESHIDDYGASKILNIITAAYNGIHKYDKDDKILEQALDIFDEILDNDEIRRTTRFYLDRLDSQEG